MDEDAPTPDVLILTRQPSSYAVPSALVVVGLAFASVYYLSFGVIFTTVQFLGLFFMGISLLDEKETIVVDRKSQTIRLHREMLGFPVATVGVNLIDVDSFDEQVEKSGSGLKRYRIVAELGTGARLPLTNTYLYKPVQDHLRSIRAFLDMPLDGNQVDEDQAAIFGEDDRASAEGKKTK